MEIAEFYSARNRIVRFLCVLLATATCSLAASAAALVENGGLIVGHASVVDGDTIEIHGERIRFNGIDAPESSQACLDGRGKKYRCGSESAQALAQFLAKSSPISCDFVERDRYGRFVGNCRRADGASVQGWLVENGFAFDWPRYSHGAYAPQQERARRAKQGLWAGTFELPWEWRARNRTTSTTVPQAVPLAGVSPAGSCNIKGNISSEGERVFHVPGQEHYERTKIAEEKGDRWFCTQDEALRAGWRAALK